MRSFRLYQHLFFVLLMSKLQNGFCSEAMTSLSLAYTAALDLARTKGRESKEYRERIGVIQKWLISRNGFNDKITFIGTPPANNSFCYPIHFAVCLYDPEHLSFLIKNGARIDERNGAGQEAVYLVTRGAQAALFNKFESRLKGCLKMIAILIQNNANIKSMYEGTAVIDNIALHPELMKEVIRSLSSSDKEYILSSAYKNFCRDGGANKTVCLGLMRSIEVLLKDGVKGEREIWAGIYPIHTAIQLGLKEHVDLLIMNEIKNLTLEDATNASALLCTLGAAANTKKKRGEYQYYFDIALSLIEKGADINERNPKVKFSPLEFASIHFPDFAFQMEERACAMQKQKAS